MRVTVIGGGHGGYAAAAHLSDQGHEVRFWRRDASSFEKILTGKKISIKDYRGTRDVEIHAPTVDLAEAISGAELVVVPLPSTTHDSLATLIAPFLEEGQVVFLPPGTFGSYIFAQALQASGNSANVCFAETGTLPYLARKHSDTSVVISGYATRLPTGVWPSSQTDRAIAVIKKAYPVEPCENILSGALMNAGPIIHPPLILMNAGPLEHFEAWDIHNEGTQSSIRRVTDALDEERIALRRALNFDAPHFPLKDHYDTSGDSDEWMYGRAAHERLTDSGDWRENIDLYHHRYMVEDTCLGLSFLVSVGRWLGVPTPIAEGLLHLAGPVAEMDLYGAGRTLENLQLNQLSKEQMERLLEQGFQEENSSVNHAPIAVLGAGRMGRGIALAYAFAGVSVVLIDLKSRPKGDQERLFAEVASELDADLEFMCEAGLLPPQAKESVAKLVTCVGRESGQSELPKCDIVYEAVPERMDAKTDAFRYAGPLLREDAVIASTTSTFLVTDLMSLCLKPARCINAHWLNPAHLIPLVELSCDTTAEQDALELLQASLKDIGKVTVVCSATPGYIVPRIQSLALNEAARLVADGVATAEEVDLAVKNGFGPRFAVLGLLEFIDWGGGDILYYASRYLADNLGDRYASPEIVSENMRTGKNGLREGEGFFDYRDTDISSYRKERLMEFVAILRHRSLLPTHRH